MDFTEDVPPELRMAVAANGPASKAPPYARAPFPVLAMPKTLRQFCQDAASAMGVPVECVATPALATCAAAIGATTRIRLSATWTEPAVIWAPRALFAKRR